MLKLVQERCERMEDKMDYLESVPRLSVICSQRMLVESRTKSQQAGARKSTCRPGYCYVSETILFQSCRGGHREVDIKTPENWLHHERTCCQLDWYINRRSTLRTSTTPSLPWIEARGGLSKPCDPRFHVPSNMQILGPTLSGKTMWLSELIKTQSHIFEMMMVMSHTLITHIQILP